MKKLFSIILETAAIFFVVFLMLETALRIFPALMPPSLLINFQKDLREEIAKKSRLPLASDRIVLERDDGGPPLRIYKPGAEIAMPFDRDDKGAVSVMRMDGRGFCNAEGVYERETIDIIALGDSFAWCVGVKPEDAWAGRLAFLAGRPAYSLGLGGTGPYEYLQLLKKFGLPKSPKAVIMNIYGGNDFRAAAEFFEYRRKVAAEGGKEYLVSPCVGLPKPLCFIYRTAKEGFAGRKSYAFNLIANGTREGLLKIKRSLSPGAGEKEPNFRYRLKIGGREILFNRGNADVDDLEYAGRLKNGETKLDVFDAALKSFVELSLKHNFRPAVSFTPAAYAAYKELAAFEDPGAGELIQRFSDEERGYFRAKAGELGYYFIDFTPALQAAAASAHEEPLYFPSNVHLTKAGHAVIAGALDKFFREAGIFP